MERERRPVYVIADNIRSLHNIGSLFRTCDACGVRKLYLCGISGKPPRKEISKTAVGAENNVPWEYHADILTVLKHFRSENIPVLALEHTETSRHFQKTTYPFPLCLILGNEVEGISEEALDYADIAVEIPMFGIKQSLNVSVAAGVMLYELLRQLDTRHE
ncbi:MAG: RNA methyltransferase [Candidatus Marinimicrobia bacterium]|nr:RNA methyltransferase [Candidatus Neomarinimicrobiota bacterium]